MGRNNPGRYPEIQIQPMLMLNVNIWHGTWRHFWNSNTTYVNVKLTGDKVKFEGKI